jgi:hypothetical protein
VSSWLENDPEVAAERQKYCDTQGQQKPNGRVDEPASIAVWDAADALTESIPPREWLLGNVFCKQFTSSLVGAGGSGKSALRVAQALAVATGRSGLTGEHVHKRGRALFLSLEDGSAELKRRVLAAMLHHEVAADDVRGWLFFATVSGHRLIEMDARRNRTTGTLDGWLRHKIEELGVDLVVFDPFVKLHGIEENDNSGIDAVCALLANIAVERNIAVDYLHHIRKGSAEPGDADNGRGASAAKDAGRLVFTLTPMSQDEAKLFGIENEKLRRSLVRMDPAKVNLAPPGANTDWFKLVGVPLNNASVNYPNGDTVQTVERWTPPDTFAQLSDSITNAILNRIEAGPYQDQEGRYSPAPNAKDRAAWPVVQEFCPALTEQQSKEVIKTWVKNSVLVVNPHKDPKDRNTKPSLFVGNRPGNRWEK